jgi:hypothetical protein
MRSIIGKKTRIAIGLAIILALMGAASAVAQGGLTYTSGVQVVNLESTMASITLKFYDPDGNLAGSLPDTISGNSSKTYFPLTGVSAGFKGSMVIEADKQVAAIANLITTDFSYNASTTGFSGGSTSFSLPLVMCNNNGFNTFFSVQNAGGGADANVTINYVPGSDGKSGVSEAATIKMGAAKTFDQTVGSTTKNCTDLAGSSGKFIGSATITSDQPVVATAMQLNTGSFKVLMGYNGFASGSATVSLPLVMANNNGFYTGIQVQNVSGSSTDVTIDYSPNTSGIFEPVNETFTLAAGASKTIIQNGAASSNGGKNDWTGKGKYIGAATVTSSPSQPLVAIVNQVSLGGGGLGPFGTAYEGFDPSTATANVSAPLVMANNSGYYTGIQVQNVGGSSCAGVTIDYGPNVAPSGTFNPANESFSLAASASKTIIQNGPSPANGGVNDWSTAGRYIGSAEISAPGCTIVAIINEVSIASGDRYMTYDGFNH